MLERGWYADRCTGLSVQAFWDDVRGRGWHDKRRRGHAFKAFRGDTLDWWRNVNTHNTVREQYAEPGVRRVSRQN